MLSCQVLGMLFHSTLLQFTQLNEYLAIDSGVCLSMTSLRALNAHGWMLPRKVEMVLTLYAG